MTPPARDQAYARAVAFMNSMEERSAQETDQTPVGPAFFHPKYSVRYDLNFLRVDEPTATADEVIAVAEELFARRGLKHRKLQVGDEELGRSLAAGLAEHGWRVDRLVVMAHDGSDVPSYRGEVVVERVRLEDMLDEYVKWDLAAGTTETEETARELAVSNLVTADVLQVDSYRGILDGEVAGWCELFSEDDVRQIENVCTYAGFRGRGVARACMVRALWDAATPADGLMFLVADDNDWPKEFYGRLGFYPVGLVWDMLLQPTPPSATSRART